MKFDFEEFFDFERQLITFLSQDVDEASQTLLPPDATDLMPIKCLGEDNCLCNSVLLTFIGDNR